ncbi:unnamed protein product [Nyctereutes procyonoides]|uniref:(raccoon dog) hypothetical protein n=1 Tax=Nyctereutes procyonoides TaxID=34880 RepID=A0A811YXG1_NYCPR|nr:unnamed protein product [Nyctereutes procyonoides]
MKMGSENLKTERKKLCHILVNTQAWAIQRHKSEVVGIYTGFIAVRPDEITKGINRPNHRTREHFFSPISYHHITVPAAAPVPRPLCPLHGLTPYQVPFNAVALRIIHADVAPTHILYAVTASWVGLCKILDDVRVYANGPILLAQTPICDCLGFGICRGFDMEKSQRGLKGTIPYITTDYNFKLPGASEKIGSRETEETCEEKVHPKPKLYRRIN